MATSYNGWSASPSLNIRPLTVAGESFVPGVRDDDDVYTVLQYVAEQMHQRVEPVYKPGWHSGDDWGFSYRASTGDPSALSCHASGTAIDYNSTRHPYGVSPSANFSSTQIREIRKILAELDQVVRWGGDFNTPDAMHFEINAGKAAVAKVARKIRDKDDDMPLNKEDKAWLRQTIREEAVKAVQDVLDVPMNEFEAGDTAFDGKNLRWTVKGIARKTGAV